MTTQNKDPFEQLVDAMQEALDWISDRADKASDEAARRVEQRDRVVKAMGVLNGEALPAKAGKRGGNTGHVWTDEQRQAASERMRKRNQDKKEAAQAVPLDGEPPSQNGSALAVEAS